MASSGALNILLLGETGVGKSTWINSFLNYLSFSNITEALKSPEIKVLIPTKFTITNEDFSKVVVSVGKASSAENTSSIGQSATQISKVYSFKTENNLTVNFIDTPGIGDSRGAIQDAINIQNIMETLKPLGNLHGICILLKPNESRLTLGFRFCIQELLGHFHKDAIKNIVFVFTNTRANMYRPGESIKTLRTLIDNNLPGESSKKITLNSKTIFCYDSEAFRFLAAKKQKVSFPEDALDSFTSSWDKSSKEAKRMIAQIRSLSPHPLWKTIDLYKIRKTADVLVKPITEASTAIQKKLNEKEALKKNIMAKEAENAQLKEYLSQDKEIVVIRALRNNQVNVVCTEPECAEVMMTNAQESAYHFENPCEIDCQCWYDYQRQVNLEVRGESGLVHCEVFGRSRVCHSCGHPWQSHMFVDHDTRKTVTRQVNYVAGAAMLYNVGSNFLDNTKVSRLENEMVRLSTEKSKILEVLSHFMRVLQSNAIDDVNDAMKEYLDHLIKLNTEKGNKAAASEVTRLKKDYDIKLSCVGKTSTPSTKFNLNYEASSKLAEDLVTMEYSGEKIRQALNSISKLRGKLIPEPVKPQEEESCVIC